MPPDPSPSSGPSGSPPPLVPIIASLFLVAPLAVAQAPASSEDPFLGAPKAQILLLGTFHFKDAGLDSYKPQFDVDILSEKRQAEVADIVERLAAFRPTKIAVEWTPENQQEVDDEFRRYLAGELELGSNEVYQLGFRLAARLGRERVHLVDAKPRWYEPWVDPEEYAKEKGQEGLLVHEWDQRFEAYYRYKDELKTRQTLREHLLYLNAEEQVLRSHGHYLVGSFQVGLGADYPGVDSRTAWYNRNLRIFANLQRITDREDERILLIIGSGHLPILRHCVQASPEYQLVELEDYL